MVYGLAQDGNAPKAFGKLSIRKVPQNALLFSCIFLLAGLVLLYSGDSVIGRLHRGHLGGAPCSPCSSGP